MEKGRGKGEKGEFLEVLLMIVGIGCDCFGLVMILGRPWKPMEVSWV